MSKLCAKNGVIYLCNLQKYCIFADENNTKLIIYNEKDFHFLVFCVACIVVR